MLRANPNEFGLLRPVEDRPVRKKPPYLTPHMLNTISRMNKEGIKETFNVDQRSSTIIPSMIGHTIAVLNGRQYISLTITEGMVGYTLRNFIDTHTFNGHPKSNKKTAYRRVSKGPKKWLFPDKAERLRST